VRGRLARVSEPVSHLDDPPVGKARRRVVWLVRACLLLQLVVPLSYYLQSGDPYDERFAWRMFSAVRLHSCRTTASESVGDAERAIPLPQTLHQAWVNHLARNRRDVVLAFLTARCEEENVVSVELRNECSAPDGSTLEPQIYRRTCATGELELPDLSGRGGSR
jgi:hypothetical protein